MIEVRVEEQWHRNSIAVWIVDRHGDETSILRPDLQLFDRIHIGEQLPEPSLRLAPELVEPLVDALGKFAAPDKAMANHLQDTITVRDRLLSIVERTTDG